MGTGTEARTVVAEIGTGTRIMGIGTRIGSGKAEERRKRGVRTRKNSCRRQVENGGDFGGKRKKRRRKERVGPVVANSDNVESNKEAGG